MKNPIHTLMAEHRLIEEVLASLEGFALRVEHGRDTPREAVARYADFFAEYADRAHQGKEENVVFSRMVERGVSSSEGPLAMMLAEHAQGRACVQALHEIGSGTGAMSDEERATLRERADEYVDLLRHHIAKEDRVLFPIAIRTLSESDMEELGARFEEIAAEEESSGRAEHLRALARGSITEYPPPWPTGTSCDSCAGCGLGGPLPR
jgi:hemerythrin-like domain-containing protein